MLRFRVSVPSRGFGSDDTLNRATLKKSVIEFPSPLGVLGLTTRWGQAQVGRFLAFPSPLGVLGLTTLSTAPRSKKVLLSFRPLSGFWV
ncbi:Uncharacterised protein [Mycobacterium tuberculosis]|nr:Uncharacterised protein [Mycobacterium tuberculosis]